MPRHAASKRFTVDDYHAMAAAGILGEDDRVELIEGEIVEMAAIGSRHASTVNRLNRFLVAELGAAAIVSPQNPVRLDDFSEPEPDVAVVAPRADFYAEEHPGPGNVLWLVEVMDSTAAFDREVKLPLYARHGIPEVWLVDLAEDAVEVHRKPRGAGYAESEVARSGDTVAPRALPDLRLAVRDLLG